MPPFSSTVSTPDDRKRVSVDHSAPSVAEPPLVTKDEPLIFNPKLTKRRLLGRILSRLTSIYDFVEKIIPLWGKLGVITIPSLVGLVGLAVFLFVDSAIRVDASSKTDLAITGSQILQSCVVRLQTERGLYGGFTLTNGEFFGADLTPQDILTDQAIERVVPLLNDLQHVDNYQESVETLKYLFRGLSEKRIFFRENYIEQSRTAVFDYYTQLIDSAIGLKSALAKEAMNASGALPKSVLLMQKSMDLLAIMDVIADRRAIGTPVVAENSWQLNTTFDRASYETYNYFVATITHEQQLKKVYKDRYKESDWERFGELVQSPQITTDLAEFQEAMVSSPHSSFNNTSPQLWFNLCTTVIRNIRSLNEEIMTELIESNRAYLMENIVRLVVSIVIIVFFVIPTIIVVAFVCRMIYKPVIAQKKNLKIALELAEALYNLNFDSLTVKQLKEKADKECSQLEKAFKLIMENFQSFMPYIPRHLLLRDDDDAEKKKDVDDAASVSTVDSSHSSSKHSSRNSKKSQQQSTTTSGSKNSSGKRRRTAAKVSRKTSTIMCIDLNDFSKGASEMNFALLQSTYAEYLSIISEMLEKNNGIIISFSGGVIICAWGAASRVFDQEAKAATMAMDLIRATFSNPKLSFRLRIGIATSECTCGELGNNEMRAFNVVGVAASRATQLAKLCKHYKCSVLVDKNTFKQVNFSFDAKQVDSVTFEESGLPLEPLYSLVQSKGVMENEWMYTMQDSQKKDIFSQFNNAWMYVVRGDFTKARTSLDEFKSALEGMSSDALLRNSAGLSHLEKIINRGEEDVTYRYKSVCSLFKVEDNTDQ